MCVFAARSPHRWMEACLDEELPPTTELEEGLRNGVYLAKLGNFFAPRTVSLKKIYDREQTRYKVKTCIAYLYIIDTFDSAFWCLGQSLYSCMHFHVQVVCFEITLVKEIKLERLQIMLKTSPAWSLT